MHLSGTNVLELELRMLGEISKLQTQINEFYNIMRYGLVLNYDMSRQKKKIDKIAIATRNVHDNLQEFVNNHHPPQQVKVEVKQESQ